LGEKTYDAGGASPDIAEEIDSASSPAELRGESKSSEAAMKVNKYRIDYSQKTRKGDQRISNKNNGSRKEELESNERNLEPPAIDLSSSERRIGFEYPRSDRGEIGFEPDLRRKIPTETR
jgi:hypothetical protein